MILTLTRDTADREVTLGRLAVVPGLVLDALELPWIPDPKCIGGCPDKSCVPAGTYELALHDSQKFPRHFALVNPALGVYHMPADVPHGLIGRTACLLHVGNFTRDVEGCCVLGRARRYVGEQWMVTDSKDAYADFAAAVPWIEGHQIIISYAPGITP